MWQGSRKEPCSLYALQRVAKVRTDIVGTTSLETERDDGQRGMTGCQSVSGRTANMVGKDAFQKSYLVPFYPSPGNFCFMHA